MKKRIAILYSGQIRTNSLVDNPRDTEVIDSLAQHLLNDEFKAKYDYDVFISTDSINVAKAFMFFGDNLANIGFQEASHSIFPMNRSHIARPDDLYKKFVQRDFKGFEPYAKQYHQYYRSYIGYEMVMHHQNMTGTKYDYFIKLRPDVKLQKSFLPIFEELDNGKKAFMEHNLFEVGSFEFFELYYRLAHYYGDYHECLGDGMNRNGEYPNYCPMDCNNIKFSSEMQVTNCLYQIMREKGYPPEQYFFGSIYNGSTGSERTYCVFHR